MSKKLNLVVARIREARDAIDAVADAMTEAGIVRGRLDMELEAARFDRLARDLEAVGKRRRGAR